MNNIKREYSGEESFKVLLIYANKMMENLIPINVSILSAVLRKSGFDVKLFDTTFYPTEDESGYDIRSRNLQIRNFDFTQYGINLKQTDMYTDFRSLVEEYRPDLIGLSAVEETYPLGISLLKTTRDFRIPTIVGGIHAIFSPEEVLAEEYVDMICIGEGEEALVELCEKMQKRQDFTDVGGIWFKKNGTILKNPRRRLVDIKNLPFPDFSIYEENRMYRPMQGKIHKMLPIESSRGCPFACTYCAAPSLKELYKGMGSYYRRKNVERIIEEIKFYIERYGMNYVYFTSETFLSMNDDDFERFVDFYKDIRLPFWIQTRPETIKEDRIRKLEAINCDRITVGIESGNEELRRNLLKRTISNKAIINAFRIFEKFKIPVSVNNIIGFPDETREQIFDTINLNRAIKADSISVFIFTPYRGTKLREYCVEKGYITPDMYMGSHLKDTVLKMPTLTNEEIKGLFRTFPLYVKLPKEYYSRIEKAEKFDHGGNEIFNQLSEIYKKQFFGS